MTNMNHPSVVVASGAEAGTVLSIDEVLNDFSIGSDDGCHLVLSGDAISPAHASVFLDDDGKVTITDTKSRTGVFVNGAKVAEKALADGDEISLGPPDHPGSGRLRFSATGSDAPLVDLAALESPLEFLPEAAPAMVDEFPPPEMLAEPEPLPAAPPLPPPPVAPPAVAKPVAVPAAKPSAPAPSVRKPPAKRSVSEGADDPLAGLAESLGAASGERFDPPPAAPDTPAAATAPKRTGASPAVMAARLAVIAAVLGGGAWLVSRKYAASFVVPVVDTYLPNPAEPGQTVTINGSGFGADADPTLVRVMLGPHEAPVLDANPTRINITVPESLGASGSQTLPLKVTAQGTTSTSRLLKISVTPKIASLTPRVALKGDEVEIAGKWLANAKTKPTATVSGNDAEILEATPTRIRIRIPEVAATEGQKVSVRVAVGSELSKEAPLHYGRLPFIDSVLPARARPGEIATIAGVGLTGPDLAVVVSGKGALILSATEAEIKISVPGIRLSEGAGRRDLTVHANEKTSIAHPIEILRESSALYSPRFFAEMWEGSRVAISCELGPVMVLGSDGPSKKRAHEAAARLNALASQGRTSRVQFSASDVTINAPGGAVLAVSASDGSGNARSLAGLWAAHLTDMFDLFLQGRRPGSTVELSPDGKVFLDIFAAARRRSAEPGVAQGVLFSPDPSWLRSLAALAAAPTLGSSQATALLDGFWAGAIEVPGATQPRKIEISLTATPSGLVGQKTSRQGRLSTDVTLQNLSYSRRDLRFSFVDSGENLNYLGRLDGDVIEGNVTKAFGARVGKLTFKLTR